MSVFQNTKIDLKGAHKPVQTGVYLTTTSILGIENLYLNSYKFQYLMLDNLHRMSWKTFFL